MELSISLITQICALFLMIFVGFILIRTHICKLDDSKVLSLIVLYVSAPCAIINSFQIELTVEKMQGFLLSILAAIIVHIVYIGLTYLLSKVFHFCSVEKASIIYSNAGNLIIPLVTIILGAEWVFYAAGYMIVQTILLWTHCKIIISEDTSFDIKKILFNINILSIIIGLGLFLLQIKLPTVIQSATTGMGNLMGPLSMMVVGMLLANIDLSTVFKNKRAYLLCFLRLIFLPLIILLIFVYSGLINLTSDGQAILMISLLAASAPCASTVTQFAQLYDNKQFEASVINALSVLMCIVTMPLINIIYMTLS